MAPRRREIRVSLELQRESLARVTDVSASFAYTTFTAMTKLQSAFLLLYTLATALSFAPCPSSHTALTARGISVRSRSSATPFLPRHCTSSLHVSQTDETEALESDEAQNESALESLRDLKSAETLELWEKDSKNVELYFLLAWGIALSAFILINNFVEPWPMPQMVQVPERFWRATHVVSGMLFGGGIVLTTAIEWLVASNKNPSVLQFWFDKVPLLDAAIVLPSLTISVISGTGLTIENYGGLGTSPPHIPITFYALVSFATWWAATDLTTQGKTLVEVNEWVAASTNDNTANMPKIVTLRRISNVVSCFFVVALFLVMILKPGVIYFKEIAPLFESS